MLSWLSVAEPPDNPSSPSVKPGSTATRVATMVRLSPELLEKVDDYAQGVGVSRNEAMTTMFVVFLEFLQHEKEAHA